MDSEFKNICEHLAEQYAALAEGFREAQVRLKQLRKELRQARARLSKRADRIRYRALMQKLPPEVRASFAAASAERERERRSHQRRDERRLSLGILRRAGALTVHVVEQFRIPELWQLEVDWATISRPLTNKVLRRFWERNCVPFLRTKFPGDFAKPENRAGNELLQSAAACHVMSRLIRACPPRRLPPDGQGKWSVGHQLKQIAVVLGCQARSRTVKPKLESIGSDLRFEGRKNYCVRLDMMQPRYRERFDKL